VRVPVRRHVRAVGSFFDYNSHHYTPFSFPFEMPRGWGRFPLLLDRYSLDFIL
jgi:hypothetical protein